MLYILLIPKNVEVVSFSCYIMWIMFMAIVNFILNMSKHDNNITVVTVSWSQDHCVEIDSQ